MQVAFQNENVLENNTSSAAKIAQNFGLGEAGLNFRNSQANFKTHKKVYFPTKGPLKLYLSILKY